MYELHLDTIAYIDETKYGSEVKEIKRCGYITNPNTGERTELENVSAELWLDSLKKMVECHE